MLSSLSRTLTYFLAGLYAVVGAALFVAPSWSAANFAWNISPFVSMTIGGWCLGTAFAAWDAARVWRWAAVYPNLVYLWVFGLGETAVLVEFQERLLVTGPVAWLYLLALGVNVLAAVLGFIDWLRLHPSAGREGVPVAGWVRGAVILFAGIVAILAVLVLTARQDTFLTNGGLFPENLTLFTLHAGGAFFTSLVASAISVMNARGMEPVLSFMRYGIALILPITAAILFNLDKFDLINRPGGLLYIAAYLAALVGALIILASHRSRSPAIEGPA